jgi:CHAT domain-containing protein/predicted negative regulator of RcsB-dependent stress response
VNALVLALLLAVPFADETPCADAGDHGRNDEAVACYQQLLSASSDPNARARLQSRLAWLHWKTGDFERSLATFNELLATSRALHDRSLEGNTINFIGLLYQMIGEPPKAIAHYKQALEIAREINDRNLLAIVDYHLGWIEFVQKDYASAVRYYEQSLALRRELNDRKGEATTLLGLGMAHASLSQYDKALQFENEALALIVESGDRRSEADARDHIGTALTFLHRENEAIEQHTRALQIRRETGARWSESFSLSGLAHAQHELGHLDQAAARLKEIVDILEEGRRKLSTRAFRGSMQAGAHGHYERYIGVLMELHDNAAALAASEQSRARLTLDSVQDALLHAADHEPELRAEIEKRAGDTLTARQIQSDVLDDDSVLVEYALGKEKSFAWTVTRDAIEGHELPPRAEIESAAVRLHELLSAGDQRANRHDIETLIARLSKTLIAPLHLPRSQRRLIVVPDGALFYVPFAALERRGVALIDDYELTTAPSASVLALMRKSAERMTHDAGVAIFADPVFGGAFARLPATRAEAETIASLARGSRKALDFDASRATLTNEDLGRYRVVHFATHALVNTQTPERSGIVLSLIDRRGAPVDGFVRVADLYHLDVESDMVVLSACKTALGKELRGEGIVGLVSGFMHAGTPRVVASFWDVKDAATAELMERFYRGLFVNGQSPAAALRSAQRSMRKEERFQSPYYWAAFSLYGVR